MYPAGERDAPLDILWRPPAVLTVTVVGVCIGLVLALAPGITGDRVTYFGLATLFILWVGLCSMSLLFALRKPLAELAPTRVAWVALASLVLVTTAMGGLAYVVVPSIAFGGDPWHWLGHLFLLSLTIGTMGLAGFTSHWRNRQLAVRAARAELEALQARIRPHFLFNTLNTGAALVHDKPEAAEDLLLDLADLFRAALSGPELIDLADELELARRYLHIEQLRFGDRLRVRWEVPDVLPEVKVPALSLQPLVENAVRHGVEPCPEGGELLMQVAVGRRTVQVLVQNPVARRATRQGNGHSIGLASVRARIEALSEGRSRLEVLPGEGVYRVAIVVPLA